MTEDTDFRVCLSPQTLHAELVEAERLRDFYRDKSRRLLLAFVAQTVTALAAFGALALLCGGSA